MKNEIKELIAKDISNSYYHVLLDGFEEYQHKFPLTLCIVNFIVKLREKNIVYDLEDIFTDKFLDLMYQEANKYIGE